MSVEFKITLKYTSLTYSWEISLKDKSLTEAITKLKEVDHALFKEFGGEKSKIKFRIVDPRKE